MFGAPSNVPRRQTCPSQGTYGSSKDKRPDLKQCILSTLCVDRAVPVWGQCDDGNASDKVLDTLFSVSTDRPALGTWVQPDAYLSIADAALVTDANRAARGDTLCITRWPATLHAYAAATCGGGGPQPLGRGGGARADATNKAPARDL